MDLEKVRRRYIAERPGFERVAELARDVLAKESSARGLPVVLGSRTKAVDSVLKKLLLKPRPLSRIMDKAGVRVVCPYVAVRDSVDRLVQERFAVRKREDKLDRLAPGSLDYLGIHYEVTLRDADLPEPDRQLAGHVCEIQIHTQAQHAWSTVSHELLYKVRVDPPATAKRSVYRLMALVELFDAEMTRARENITMAPGYEEAKMLNALEVHFLRLTGRNYQPALSNLLIAGLKGLYTPAQRASFDALIDKFVTKRAAKLAKIFADYREESSNPFINQPESIMLFERIDYDGPSVLEAWHNAGQFPEALLDDLANIWGKPLEGGD